ncbi:MAG: hypothetical protein RCG15_01565 [Candidatus Rickettsia vulgarisii]
MPIESKLKLAEYPDEYKGEKFLFEQRGVTSEEKENNYFNQPYLEVSLDDKNIEKVEQIVNGIEIIVAPYGENFELKVKKYSDIAAVIIQHELNHLYTKGTYVDAIEKYKEEHTESVDQKFLSTKKEVYEDQEHLSFNKVGMMFHA